MGQGLDMKTRLLACCLACFVTSISYADVTGSSNGDGGMIPDNSPTGYVSTVTITDSEVIQEAAFSIEGLQHFWIGDLTITVDHSTSGKSAVLVHRVGTTANPNSVGDSSDVNGTYTFEDGNASIWSEAASGDTDYVVNPGTYDASGVNEAIVNLNSIFGGEMTNGDWVFTISDHNATQTGSFFQTSVAFVSAIPEPGMMAVIVIGTLLGGICLRRRHGLRRKLEQSLVAQRVQR